MVNSRNVYGNVHRYAYLLGRSIDEVQKHGCKQALRRRS